MCDQARRGDPSASVEGEAASAARAGMSDEQQLHERLRALLPHAHAESCQVVATFLDIRSFSAFAARSESFDAAIYLRSVYQTVLTSVFADTHFFKPTGDGLLLVHQLPSSSEQVPPFVSTILRRCVLLVREFGHITGDDFMVNFPVPQQIGIGVARGSATRLVSGSIVLDYTGRCLNLAARLMDKARPSGVVFADLHADRLIDEGLALSFSADRVCIRGIAEEDPIAVSITDDVVLSPADREPIGTTRNVWGYPTEMDVADVKRRSNFGFYLPRAPRSYESASVHVEIPGFRQDGERDGSTSSLTIAGDVEEEPDGCLVRINLRDVHSALRSVPSTVTSKFLGLTRKTKVKFTPFIEPSSDVP
jgi:class 3 adenylate cyclase